MNMEKSSRFPATTNPSSSIATTTSAAADTATTAAAAANFTNKPAHTSVDNTNSSGVCSDHSTATNDSSNSLRALNRSSYKISKPISRNPIPNPLRPSPPLPPAITTATGSGQQQQQQPQPPVYNIDKNNFRDVVQKLTGSPAHLINRPPPPAVAAASPLHPQNPRPLAAQQPLSRLHRIRPPPLAQLSPLPPPVPAATLAVGEGWVRPAPLSPLPPFPTVSAAAESPISAYMRRLRSGQPLLAPSPQGMAPLLPLSPLAFGCAPSPRTAAAYQVMLSPTLLFSASPGLQIPRPKLGEP